MVAVEVTLLKVSCGMYKFTDNDNAAATNLQVLHVEEVHILQSGFAAHLVNLHVWLHIHHSRGCGAVVYEQSMNHTLNNIGGYWSCKSQGDIMVM